MEGLPLASYVESKVSGGDGKPVYYKMGNILDELFLTGRIALMLFIKEENQGKEVLLSPRCFFTLPAQHNGHTNFTHKEPSQDWMPHPCCYYGEQLVVYEDYLIYTTCIFRISTQKLQEKSESLIVTHIF